MQTEGEASPTATSSADSTQESGDGMRTKQNRMSMDEINRLPPVITTHEVGGILGRCDQHIERMAKASRIPAHKVGRTWLYNKSEILALVGLE
jgi:excisionase family DNA binding protein